MYEDLARTQEASLLEHFVLTSVIPSLVITSLLHADLVWNVRTREEPSVGSIEYSFVCFGTSLPLASLEDLHHPLGASVRVGVPEVVAVESREEQARFWQYGVRLGLDLVRSRVPSHPKLLRPAGTQGRVVLEAVIDTLGHVEPGSVLVVESAHPAFVAPAQHSLLTSLFRPARVQGRAVRVRVRLAFDFVLRDGRL